MEFEVNAFDAFNRLTAAESHGHVSEYSYRPDGMRHSKTVDGVLTTHVWDGANIVADVAEDSATLYVRGVNLIAAVVDGAKNYFLYNAHGDVVQFGEKQYLYDAFGNELNPDEDDGNSFRYAGEYYDAETGDYYLRARYYDTATGRFGAEDPIRDGLNYYTYCLNNPILLIDPFGMKPSPEEALNMAAHLYRYYHEMDDIPELIGGWQMVRGTIRGQESMVMGLYSRTVNGITEYAIANKGTNFDVFSAGLSDILNDLQGPLGFSTDMEDSIKWAEYYHKKYRNSELTFIGHSKGGAEAALNAVATGRDAILLNPMRVMFSAYSLEDERLSYTGRVTSYVVEGDPLNLIFGEMDIGRTTYLPQQAEYDSSFQVGVGKGVYGLTMVIDDFSSAYTNHDSPGLERALLQWRQLMK